MSSDRLFGLIFKIDHHLPNPVGVPVFVTLQTCDIVIYFTVEPTGNFGVIGLKLGQRSFQTYCGTKSVTQ